MGVSFQHPELDGDGSSASGAHSAPGPPHSCVAISKEICFPRLSRADCWGSLPARQAPSCSHVCNPSAPRTAGLGVSHLPHVGVHAVKRGFPSLVWSS